MEMIEKYFGLSQRITKWKELSDFELILANDVAKGNTTKKVYAEYYRHLNPAYYDAGKRFAIELYNSHKDDFKDIDFIDVYDDMVYSLHKYGYSFQDYCIYGFINKTEAARKEFVADKLRYYYCDILNAPFVERLMTNKYECYKEYRPFFKREIARCLIEEDRQEFLDFFRRHKEFIFKPLEEHSGHGIVKINLNGRTEAEQWFDGIIVNTPGIVEELIIQGEYMNKINPNTINSCRIVTFVKDDEVTIIGGALRMGVGTALTDNAGAGGIYASIDVENGIIQSDAKNYSNQHYKFHPTTGTYILGFSLPEWAKAKELIKSMALHKKGTTLISWDIAYSKNGWCMVEANDNGDWSIIQSNLEKGKKEELFKLMDSYFESKR